MTADNRRRWIALVILCLGDLMIVLDATIVNVALPSIRKDLGFSQTSLAWVVNAYLLTYGGCLLLRGAPPRAARGAGGRGGGPRGRVALAHDDALHRAGRPGQGHGRLRVCRGRGR